jgi:putative hydrolase of the HAD superfamily
MIIKCITFDLDDTLWACSPVLTKAEKACYNWFSQYYPKITAKYNEQQLFASRQQYMQEHPEQSFNFTTVRLNWLAQLADEFSYPTHMVEDAFQVFWLVRNQVIFFEDALESLDQLSANFSLGTISNGNADVNHIGIGQYFDFNINVIDAGVAKPEPEIFQKAVQLAGCAANNILHIGDHPQCDVLGALNAGLHAIWYNSTQSEWLENKQPTAIIHQLREIEAQIQLIQQGG